MQIGDDNENILRRMILLMQERDYRKLTHQNLIAYEILQHVIIPQEYHNFMNFDKNAIVFSWMLSNLEFALEIERLISRNKLSLEYIKSIEHVLLWLIKLFDIKWRQLHDDFDYISRLHLKRLLNLQRQVEFVLENLVADNQRQHRKSKDDKYILEDRSDILNTEKFKAEGAILIDKNKANFFETNKTEITTNKSSEIPNDRITSELETLVNHAELLKHIKDNNSTSITSTDQKFNTPTSVKDKSISNSTFFSKIKTLRDNDFIKNETSSKSKKFTDTRYDKHMKDHRKRFDQLKNVSSISLNENSTLKETDQSKRVGTNAILHTSLENVTDIKPWSRRTLQVLVYSNKNEEQRNKFPSMGKHTSTRKTSDKHYFNEGTKIRSDRTSAIDEILEAVDGVLPTDKSVELSPKGPNTISRIF